MNESDRTSSILGKIKAQTTSIHIFLIFFLVFTIIVNSWLTLVANGGGVRGVLGGPDDYYSGDLNSGRQVTVLQAVSSLGDVSGRYENSGTNVENDVAAYYLIKSAALSNKGAVLGGALTRQRSGVLTYRVQEGDNLSKIAAQFGVSLNTILWANDGTKNKRLHPGDELTVLPVSGVLHEVKPGDTMASIAGSFGVPVEAIVKTNHLENSEAITAGEKIIVPHGKPLNTLASILAASGRNLPSIAGFFAFPMPQNSWNWGILHNENAVDIANVCGTPIYAAASGLVLKTGSPELWNTGYGGYVILEHQNGTETLYGHTQANLVDVGSFVEQGDTIAKVGQSGKATGCHLHFEVKGARNLFAK